MSAHIRASLLLTVFSIALASVAYPLVVLVFGQALLPDKADGSMLYDKHGNLIGSRLIAQPFSGDEFFHPRPSAVGYNAAAAGGSNWAANNYLLRDRVARILGPIVKYSGGDKKGQLVAADIEAWFQQDKYQGAAGIVAQWADAHNGLAQAWVGATFDPKSPTPQQQYVLDWQKGHAEVVAQFIKDNPGTPEPNPADLAVVFFETFSKEHPGKFLTAVTKTEADGKTSTTTIEPASDGTDIQSTFFDMWRQDHPTVELEKVPADMVMASGAGLDPDITVQNATYQLDGVAAAWAKKTKGDEVKIRGEIAKMIRKQSVEPLSGLAGVPLVNVLELNLALRDQYEKSVVEGSK